MLRTLLLLAAFTSIGMAQQRIPWFAIDASGTGPAASATHVLYSSVGQPIIGTAGSQAHRLHSGFLQFRAAKLTDVASTPAAPAGIILHQNHPNPFNPTTCVEYEVPEAADVRLDVSDLLGRTRIILADGPHAPGVHQVVFNGADHASGVWLVTLRVSTRSYVVQRHRRMILLK